MISMTLYNCQLFLSSLSPSRNDVPVESSRPSVTHKIRELKKKRKEN